MSEHAHVGFPTSPTANVARLNVNRACMQERDDRAIGRSAATTASRPHNRALTERGNQSMP